MRPLRQLTWLIILFITGWGCKAYGQNPELYQLSGMVLEETEGLPVSFVRIGVKHTRRGTFANETGFFSLPVTAADTLLFSRLGYSQELVPVQDILNENRGVTGKYLYTVQFMQQDSLGIDPIEIRPYNSAHEIKMALLNMPMPSESSAEFARDNLDPQNIGNYVEGLPVDANDPLAVAQQQYLSYYATRSLRPFANVVDPVAVVKLIQYMGQQNQAKRERVYNYWPEE